MMPASKLRRFGLALAAVLVLGLVGTHSLHLYCTGQGRPTVLLEAGMGGWSNDWVRVQPALAMTATVCSYDRPGFGWSEATELPLTAANLTAELHTLLERSGTAGPFVMVGHSLGGLLVQNYAATYPSEGAGLVLVDSSHEQQMRLQQELTGRDAPVSNTLQCTGLVLSPIGVTRLVMGHIADSSRAVRGLPSGCGQKHPSGRTCAAL